MARGLDLESIREILADNKVHLALGVITQLSLAPDRSVLRVMVKIWPENREIVARMTWESVGPDAGTFTFPVVNDLVLVACPDGEQEEALVIRRLTSKEDRIPVQAATGDTVVKAINGKRNHVLSDTMILLGRGTGDATENIPLGQVLKGLMSAFLAATAAHKHIGNLGFLTAPPDNASEFDALKASPVEDEAMLSDLSFTEK